MTFLQLMIEDKKKKKKDFTVLMIYMHRTKVVAVKDDGRGDYSILKESMIFRTKRVNFL